MSAKLKAETAIQRKGAPQTRRATRLRSHARALVLSSQGDRSKALVCDVSVHGCCLETDSAWMRMGQFITLRLSSDWTIQAIVRWVRDEHAGIEFLRPIDSADARAISGD